jgi:hypothetical protein
VVGNGESDNGSGIVFDDLAGAVNDPPGGLRSTPYPLIRNNIAAYNEKAGIRPGFYNTVATEEVAYNLLYDNWQVDGSYFDCAGINWWFRCKKRQLGGYYLTSDEDVLTWDDPLFEDMTPGSEDFNLQASSPAIDAGDPDVSYNDAYLPPSQGTAINDVGAYGGPDSLDW